MFDKAFNFFFYVLSIDNVSFNPLTNADVYLSFMPKKTFRHVHTWRLRLAAQPGRERGSRASWL